MTSDFQKQVIRKTSIPHPGGDGDTHVDPFKDGFVVTDRFKQDVTIGTQFYKDGNPK